MSETTVSLNYVCKDMNLHKYPPSNSHDDKMEINSFMFPFYWKNFFYSDCSLIALTLTSTVKHDKHDSIMNNSHNFIAEQLRELTHV